MIYWASNGSLQMIQSGHEGHSEVNITKHHKI